MPNKQVSAEQKQLLIHVLRQLVGSLNWLSIGTRPDITTITQFLLQYQSNPSPGHLQAAKYAIKYIKGTTDYGIVFDSNENMIPNAHLHYPKK